MTNAEDNTLKLYALAVAAKREVDGAFEIRFASAIDLALPNEKIVQQAYAFARQVLPESDGWIEHQVIPLEIPSGVEFDGYRLIWYAERIDGSSSESESE